MADRDDAVLAIKNYGRQYQPAFRHHLAYLGDGNGAVHTSQANYDLVRYPLSSSPPIEVFNTRAPAIDGLRVFIGYTPEQPNLLQVLTVADQRVDVTSGDETVVQLPPYSYLPNHAQNHMYLNVDPGLINWRQITPLGVFPTNPPSLSVQIHAGYIPRPGVDVFIGDQTVDLTSHVPGSGARYVLISFDSTGLIVATDGTINSGGFSALTAADIPNTPAGNWRSCAVVLYVGQTAIVETRTEIDFWDLRFPEENSAGELPLTNTHILVGNASNIATDVAMSGDATIANTGALTLANSGVNAMTYGDATHVAQVTLDAKGRVTKARNIPIVSRGAMSMSQAAGASGVTRSGATTDGHLAVWNGSSVDSIRDGGSIPSGTTGDFLVMQVFS